VFKGEDILLRILTASSPQTTADLTDGRDLKVQFEMPHRHYPQIDSQQCSKYFKDISSENMAINYLCDKSQAGRLPCA